eukprot:gnl/Hemi2/13103_TR4475_c0_g1_i1.p1 gnl/Hemi2/13103_TR4475_c0_g1~~gnl/Hemi2/13103_TR4475_c0_g1_i1.p1  ORF type:complete len:854 (+),score=238.49 gnl/Hemi2/13103_TR4475_c0_g1_i1:71-2632(+)
MSSPLSLSAADEANLMRAIITADNMILQQDYFLLSAKWWQLWKDYVQYDNPQAEAGQRPGAIDNHELLVQKEDGTYSPDALQPNLIEGLNHVVLSKPAWTNILSWYGGGPVISRKVIGVGLSLRPMVELYPIKLLIGLAARQQPLGGENVLTEYSFSRTQTMKGVIRLAAGMASYPPHKCKLFLVEGAEQQTEITPAMENSTIADMNLLTGHVLMLKYTADNIMAHQSNFYKTPEYKFNNTVTHYVQRIVSTEGSPPVLGVTGLHNLGNTCFMNAALQCLSNTQTVRDYFVEDIFKTEINVTNPLGKKGELARQFGSLLQDLWSGKYTAVAPSDFKTALGKFAPQFSGYQQQDCQELLAFLLDGLHEDLNRVEDKPQTETVESNGRPDEIVAEEAWRVHQLRNRSKIVDLFQAQLKSTVRCGDCNKISITFDPFLFLSLPLPTSSQRVMIVTMHHIGQPPLKYGVRVNKFANVAHLKAQLAQEVGLTPDRLQVADMYFSQAFILPDGKELQDIRPHDQIHGFEVLGNAGCTYLHVLNRELLESHNTSATAWPYHTGGPRDQPPNTHGPHLPTAYSNAMDVDGKTERALRFTLFGVTFVVSFPTGAVSARALHAMVWNQLRHYCNSTEPPYTLRVVDSLGSDQGVVVPGPNSPEFDLPYQVPDKAALAADWSTLGRKNYFSEATPSSHPSVLPQETDTDKPVSLKDCLDLFTHEEQLGHQEMWFCPQCRAHKQAFKKFDMWSLPETLIIHLKRFHYTRNYRDKIDVQVDFPITDLDLSAYTLGPCRFSALYDLFAVANHMGGLSGGHYTANARNDGDGNWYTFDDSRCTGIDVSKLATPSSYLLFYKRREPPPI